MLSEGMVGRPRYLNPLLASQNPVDRQLADLLFNGLTRYDGTGQLVGDLAESWTVSEDGLVVTFTLRQDARWHDGEAVTSADVAYTYGLLQAPDAAFLPSLTALWPSVEIEVIDDLQIAFRLPTPYSPFLDATTLGILPSHLLQDVSAVALVEHPFNQMPVGTGLFQIGNSDWQETGRLVLTPVEGQWPQGILLDGIAFHFFPSLEDLLAAYRTGQIVSISNVGPQQVEAVAALEGVRLFFNRQPRYAQLIFNVAGDNSVVNRRDARQGLAHLLSRDAVVAAAFNGQAVPFAGPILPTSWAYNPGVSVAYPLHPLSATIQFEAAGFIQSGQEGATAWTDGEQPLSLTLTYAGGGNDEPVAAAVADQWAAAGIPIALRPLPLAQFQAALEEGDFEAALVEISPPGDPDQYDLWSQESIIDGQNYGGWNNRLASEALEEARMSWDLEMRRAAYTRFQFYFHQDIPALSLFQFTEAYVLGPEVRDLRTPSGLAEIGILRSPRDRYRGMAGWYVRTVEQPVPCE